MLILKGDKCMCTDGEYPAIFRQIWRTARKKHTCCECGSEIYVGEKYQHSSGLWPTVNGWAQYKTCEICANLREKAQGAAGENISFGCLYEFVGYEFEG